jgi:hypothetical protein
MVVAASALAAPPPSTPDPSPAQKDARPSDAGSAAAAPATARASDSGGSVSAPGSSSSNSKKRPGSGVKGSASAAQGTLGTVPEDGAPGSANGEAAVQGRAAGGPGEDASQPCLRPVPQWGALCVSTPQGLMVQLSTDGCVLMEPVDKPGAQVCAHCLTHKIGGALTFTPIVVVGTLSGQSMSCRPHRQCLVVLYLATAGLCCLQSHCVLAINRWTSHGDGCVCVGVWRFTTGCACYWR